MSASAGDELGPRQHLIVAVVAAQPHRRVPAAVAEHAHDEAHVLAARVIARPADGIVVGHLLLGALGQQDAFDDEHAARDLVGPFDAARESRRSVFPRGSSGCSSGGERGQERSARPSRSASSGSFSCSSSGLDQRIEPRRGVPAGARRRGVRVRGRALRSRLIRLFFHRSARGDFAVVAGRVREPWDASVSCLHRHPAKGEGRDLPSPGFGGRINVGRSRLLLPVIVVLAGPRRGCSRRSPRSGPTCSGTDPSASPRSTPSRSPPGSCSSSRLRR